MTTELQTGRVEFSDRHGRRAGPGLDVPMPTGVAVPADGLKTAIDELRSLLTSLDKRVAALEKQVARRGK